MLMSPRVSKTQRSNVDRVLVRSNMPNVCDHVLPSDVGAPKRFNFKACCGLEQNNGHRKDASATRGATMPAPPGYALVVVAASVVAFSDASLGL